MIDIQGYPAKHAEDDRKFKLSPTHLSALSCHLLTRSKDYLSEDKAMGGETWKRRGWGERQKRLIDMLINYVIAFCTISVKK